MGSVIKENNSIVSLMRNIMSHTKLIYSGNTALDRYLCIPFTTPFPLFEALFLLLCFKTFDTLLLGLYLISLCFSEYNEWSQFQPKY